jgi:hypothetical protein
LLEFEIFLTKNLISILTMCLISIW